MYTVLRWQLVRLDVVGMLMHARGAFGVPSEVTGPNATFSTRMLSTALQTTKE